jgi:hypothetical protein
MLEINGNPPAFASRAVGILEGQLRLDPVQGERSILLITDDGAEIPGVVHGRAAQRIIEDPSLLGIRVRALVYPRTERNKLKILIVDIEPASIGDRSSQVDLFLIQGFNLGTRNPAMSQIGIRPNKRSKHQFERFWLSLYGHLKDEQRCVYKIRALRRGRKLFIIESDPILPEQCSPKRNQPPRGTLSSTARSSFERKPVTRN